MAIPATYRKSGDNINATYDWTDIAEGSGLVTFYGFVTDNKTSYNHVLNNNPIEMGVGASAFDANVYWRRTDVSNVSTTFSLSSFNLPKVVKGTGTLSFSMAYVTGAAGAGTYFMSGALLKNGAVVQEVKSQTFADDASNHVHTEAVSITIPQTNYAAGDILAVRFSGYVSKVGNASLLIHHDPLNNDFTETTPNVTAANNTTRLRTYIPFKIDL